MLVGRDREMQTLSGALSCAANGGGLFVLVGEPGIGKTRLAAEAASRARDVGMRASWGRCWEAGGAPPFWPWREALEGLGAAFPEAAAIAASSPAEARFALFREVTGVLAREAARSPVLVVLEDLHAADPSTLLLLEFASNALRSLPVVVIGTYRDLEARLRADVREAIARVERLATVLPLPRLGEADVAEMVRDANVEDRLAASVFEITPGNPLFVGEMLRDLRARGGALDAAVPLGVREIIRQRLALISDEARRVLEIAAVLGVELGDAPLARLAGEGATLDDATNSGLLTRRDARLRFSHALYREALYQDLPRERRRAMHRDAARAVATTGAPLAEVAHHLLEGGPDVAPQAIDHALRAATQAVDAFAFEEATALLARAQATIPPGPDEAALRCRVLVAQGEARLRGGDASGREACVEAARLARELGDPKLLAVAGLAYGSVLLMGGVDPVLVGMLEESAARLPRSDSPLRARVLARLAAARQPSPPEERQRDIDLAFEAVAMARRVADRRELLAILHAATGVLYGAANPTERVPVMREIERLAEELGDTTRLLHARVRLAIDFLELGDFASYAELASSYERIAARLGPAAEPWRVPLMRSTLAIVADRFDESERWQEEARRVDADSPRAKRAQAFHRVAFLRAAERHAELRTRASEVRSLWLAMPYGHVLAEPRVAAVLAHLGAEEEVRELLARIPDSMYREQINASWLAQALWLVGDAARAEMLQPSLQFYERRWTMYWFDCEVGEGPATRLLAYVEGLRGRWDECDRLFDHARRAIDGLGWRSMGARMRFEMGDLLGRAGQDAARARSLLGEARAMATDVGLPDLVDLIDRRHPTLRNRTSARPSAATP
ncbi:MAG TPA: AAA family ATPase, partial [Labilithrix sp.]